jgi:multidrug efflux system membrane fusion protein
MSLRTIAALCASLSAAALIAGCSAQAQSEAAAPPPTQVSVAPVVFKSLRSWDEFTGRLEPIDQVQIHPRVGGYIDSVRFVEGAEVKKGQVLFQIDPRPFQAEVNRLDAEVAASRAKLELASSNRERGQKLIDQAALARSEFDRLVSEERAARATLDAAQATLSAAKLNLDFTRITSPIDGRVSRAAITPGNLVTSADLLTTVVSENPIYVSFNADEQTYLKYSGAGGDKPGPVYLGLMTEDGYPHKGRMVFVDNAMNATSGTINGRAVFENTDRRFTPGLFARVRLVSDRAESAALVPDRAIATDLGKRYVLVLGAKNVVEYRPVTTGPRVGDFRIIRAGLKAGDVVVVTGGSKVKPGQAVAPIRITPKLPEAALAQIEVGGPVQLAQAETPTRALAN